MLGIKSANESQATVKMTHLRNLPCNLKTCEFLSMQVFHQNYKIMRLCSSLCMKENVIVSFIKHISLSLSLVHEYFHLCLHEDSYRITKNLIGTEKG